jgi:hypothetical protein
MLATQFFIPGCVDVVAYLTMGNDKLLEDLALSFKSSFKFRLPFQLKKRIFK